MGICGLRWLKNIYLTAQPYGFYHGLGISILLNLMVSCGSYINWSVPFPQPLFPFLHFLDKLSKNRLVVSLLKKFQSTALIISFYICCVCPVGASSRWRLCPASIPPSLLAWPLLSCTRFSRNILDFLALALESSISPKGVSSCENVVEEPKSGP